MFMMRMMAASLRGACLRIVGLLFSDPNLEFVQRDSTVTVRVGRYQFRPETCAYFAFNQLAIGVGILLAEVARFEPPQLRSQFLHA